MFTIILQMNNLDDPVNSHHGWNKKKNKYIKSNKNKLCKLQQNKHRKKIPNSKLFVK